MNPEDRIADGLETGEDQLLPPGEQARLDELREVLGSEFIWEEPPSDLGDRIAEEIAPSGTRSVARWLGYVAAALVLVLGTVGVMNLISEDIPPAVASVTMIGTDLAPDAHGTAQLIPTPNGWAIAFDAVGLEPAAAGTFYQAWVSNGREGAAVGSFHMRGDEPTPIALWSGFDLREYRTINVAIQTEGAGPESSGVLVMTGTSEHFND